MVLAPAPRARREDVSEAAVNAANWTRSYRGAGASRALRRSVFAVSLSACALISAGWVSRTDAETSANDALTPTASETTDNTIMPKAPSMSAPVNSMPIAPSAPIAPIAPDAGGPKVSIPSSPTLKTAISPPNRVGVADTSSLAVPFVVAAPKEASSLLKAAISAAPLQSIAFRVYADGRLRTFKTTLPQGATVEQALKQVKFVVAPTDRLWPLAGMPISNGVTLHVVRIAATVRTRYEYQETQVRYKPTSKIHRGATQVMQYGQTGITAISERTWKRDGKVTSVQLVARRVMRPAQNTIIALGTKPSYMPGNVPYHRRYALAYSLASRGGSPRDRYSTGWSYTPPAAPVAPADPGTLQAVKSLTVVATGYAAGRAGGAIGNRTATGLPCGYGAVAVDPRVIPLGSKLYIEGYGYGVACDTGGAIKGNRIDLAFDSVRAAFVLGRRSVKVWILQ